jgi:hypothetical protein
MVFKATISLPYTKPLLRHQDLNSDMEQLKLVELWPEQRQGVLSVLHTSDQRLLRYTEALQEAQNLSPG